MKVLIPVPCYGSDPTEVAIPWKVLSDRGIDVVFTTPSGDKARADKLMLTGEKLGVWKSLLRARKDAVTAFAEMDQDALFCHPLRYVDVREPDFDGIFLPGGHDKAVKEYLESEILQGLVADFFAARKPVAAICHGVVLAARSIDPKTGKSVLHERRTTALLKTQELAGYNLTRLWMKDYYLTYPGNTVEDEVTSVLSSRDNFLKGPKPLFRDSMDHLERGFVVRDQNYLSARWPGDAYSISLGMAEMLQSSQSLKQVEETTSGI